MSTSMDNLRNDVHKPAEQLEREADSARSAVEGTLADLQQRLSPGEMVRSRDGHGEASRRRVWR